MHFVGNSSIGITYSPLQHIEDPWLLSASDVQRERAVDVILSLLHTFRDNMLLTVGGVRFCLLETVNRNATFCVCLFVF